MKKLVDKLFDIHALDAEEYKALIDNRNLELSEYLFEKARAVQYENFGHDIYIRGLIEFTNNCKNDCYYCGIRKSNNHADRYRLTKDQILDSCAQGYKLGYRTFVLQGGEDGYFTDEKMIDIIRSIKRNHPDCAITLSIGEKSFETYKAFFDAGADRYLLRHETANTEHYDKLHPSRMSLDNRKQCLYNLKQIGYQVGCGFMVGSPFQTTDCLVEDLLFIQKLEPHMVGIGPFIPHHATPFAKEKEGTVELTLFMLGIIRLMLPQVLLPVTTALGTIHPEGRELGILAGGNVIMPNLSPANVRKKYLLYDNKIWSGDEDAMHLNSLRKRIERIGYRIIVSRGDHKSKITND